MSQLEIDHAARTISGRAIPWNVVSTINRTKIALRKDCLTWPTSTHLILRHDRSLIVGRVVRWEPRSDGLYATFGLQRGSRGDRALAVAELGWGLSCGFRIDEDTEDDILWIVRGHVTEVSLVPDPAFPQGDLVTVNSGLPVEGAPEGGLIEVGDDTLEESQEGELVEAEESGEDFAESAEEGSEPPEFISEANRIQIEQTGEALEAFTGRTLTRDDLEAYDRARLEKS